MGLFGVLERMFAKRIYLLISLAIILAPRPMPGKLGTVLLVHSNGLPSRGYCVRSM